MADTATLQARLDELLRIAKANERKQENFREYELALLNSDGLHELLKIILIQHKDRFQLSEVTMLLYDPEYELRRLMETKPFDVSLEKQLMFTESPHTLNQYFSPMRKPRLMNFSSHQHTFLFPDADELGSIAILPLVRQNEIIGSLNLGSRSQKRFERNIGTIFLEHLAAVISACIENARLQEHIKLVGLRDALTGVNNRRFFDQRLTEEVSRARRYKTPLSCMFIDLDHFKKVNDTYGHQAGDAILKQVSKQLNSRLRQTDILARYGGEEFVILLPDTQLEDAATIAEQIRQRIESADYLIPSGEHIKATLSVGVSSLDATHAVQTEKALLEVADQCVYAAKLAGRNCVRVPEQRTQKSLA
jgi:diguanylate cyclase (GGDEF)-like protein